MARKRGAVSALLTMILVGAVAAGVVYHIPTAVSQLTYAVERGKAQASRQQLETATNLSEAFKYVAQSLRPSVVSISSVKRIQPAQSQSRRRFRGQQQMPDEMRRFFGDDFLDRFFFDMPVPPRGFEQQGVGTGVIVSSDGYILTNNHVVEQADEITVTLSDERRLEAKIVGTDKPTDLAVLKVDATNLVAAKLGDSSQLEVGDWVLAIGSPFRLDQTVTAGIVSATGRANVGIAQYEDFVQTDAAINPGNSGGPLVSLKGEVVGIATAIASKTGGNMGIGFAIPSNMAESVMNKLIETGKVERGYLGALIGDLSQELAKSFNYDSTEGVLINDVVSGGPADEAGLQPGDIVIEYNGEPVEEASELRNAVAATEAGSTAELRISRDGEEQVVEVEVGKREGEPSIAGNGGGATANDDLGLTVQTLTPERARELGFDQEIGGVIVTQVTRGSAAAAEGIRPGDVLVSVAGTSVANAADFRDALSEEDLQEGVRMQILRDGVRRFVFVKRR